jgi:ubiquinone/menaquinone biosynthesis C-methylase UbiE
MSPQLLDYPRYAWQLLNGSRSSGEREIAAMRQQDIAAYLDIRRPLQILDLANGRLRPQYALLKAAGHQVYGIDLANRPQLSRINIAYQVARQLYTWRLGLQNEPLADQTLVCGDVGVLPFPKNRFDLVTSVAAFEHFLDVPTVVTELHRVLRPGGLAWVAIHIFTSPSGGHNLSFTEIPLRHVPEGVDPWDHLRKRRLPFSVPLNEWRKDQYLAVFARHFEIIKHYCVTREGEELLTPEIAAELAAYSRDELTCGAYAIVARKVR